ncbi:MAG: hypothetical protein ACR2QS_01775 [Woeseiaceae bacterium]
MIKKAALLAAGMVFGLFLVAIAVVYNPFVKTHGLSPLTVTENEVVHLTYSAAAQDTIVLTNNGESQMAPNPPKVLQLWEPTVRDTTATLNVLEDSRGRTVGIGVKFSSDSEMTNISTGRAIVDSVWHIYLPGRGSVFIQQTENYWSYIRDIVLPAYRSSGDNWRGNWLKNITDGPGPLGTGWAAGGSGVFAGIDSAAVEALSAKAYTVDLGPVAMTGELSIEIPRPEVVPTVEAN